MLNLKVKHHERKSVLLEAKFYAVPKIVSFQRSADNLAAIYELNV
jgi:hypothetical protein